MIFKVYDEVFDKIPDLLIGVVTGYDIDNSINSSDIYKLFEDEMNKFRKNTKGMNIKELEGIVPYREAFVDLGINANKYTSSIEAISKRVAKGNKIPSINPIVDLVNYVSIKYSLPMGAHDMDALKEEISIRFSVEGDTFVPLGTSETEVLPSDELVYADINQIRTRRWIWRQSNIGKIDEDSKNIFFPIDGFKSRNEVAVREAAILVEDLLKKHFDCRTSIDFIDNNKHEIEIY